MKASDVGRGIGLSAHRLQWWIAAAFAGAFLLIVGARWMVVDRFGNDLPFHDQWNAEAVDVLLPHWSGGSIWPGLWRANNEHRLVWTRLLAVGLADLDGQWNARTQMALNAVLAALAALTVPALFRRSLPRWGLALVLVVATIGAALPLAWETAQWALLSQYQLLVLFGLAHLALTWATDRCDWRWGLGTLVGIAALGTTASGFASALASVALASWRLLRERDASASVQRFLLLTLGVNLALALVGFALVAPAPHHAAMRAHSLFTFLRGFGRVFAWPETNPLFGIAFVLPFVAVLAAGSRRRRLEEPDAMFGAVLAWYGAQAIALALARGGVPWPFPPRYHDLLALGLVLGLVCLLRLFAALRGPRTMLAGGLVLAGWLVVVGHGWHARFTEIRVNQLLEQRAALQVAQVNAVRAYLTSGNRSTLVDEPATRLLHQDTNLLADLLDNAGIRAHLPPAVRFPLRLEPEATESRNYAAFVVPPEAEQIYRAAAWRVTPTATEAARFVSEPIPARPAAAPAAGPRRSAPRRSVASDGRRDGPHPLAAGARDRVPRPLEDCDARTRDRTNADRDRGCGGRGSAGDHRPHRHGPVDLADGEGPASRPGSEADRGDSSRHRACRRVDRRPPAGHCPSSTILISPSVNHPLSPRAALVLAMLVGAAVALALLCRDGGV